MSGIMLTNEEIQEIKSRAEHQFNWANTSVLSLIDTIEKLQEQNKTLAKELHRVTNPRTATKETLKLLFENLNEDKGITYTTEQINNAIEIMHDDAIFFEELLDLFEEHLEEYGESYGL